MAWSQYFVVPKLLHSTIQNTSWLAWLACWNNINLSQAVLHLLIPDILHYNKVTCTLHKYPVVSIKKNKRLTTSWIIIYKYNTFVFIYLHAGNNNYLFKLILIFLFCNNENVEQTLILKEKNLKVFFFWLEAYPI